MSERETHLSKYQCQLCQLGDGTGDYDGDDDELSRVHDSGAHGVHDDDRDDDQGDNYDDDDVEVTAELERTRCALQSRDEEVEALTREVFSRFVFRIDTFNSILSKFILLMIFCQNLHF